jgi:hypothetical protein
MTYFPVEAFAPLKGLGWRRERRGDGRPAVPPRPLRLYEVLSDHVRCDIGLPPAERGIDYWRLR